VQVEPQHAREPDAIEGNVARAREDIIATAGFFDFLVALAVVVSP